MSAIKNAFTGLKLGNWFKNEILNTRTIDYIDFCPTWKCNARCATCGAWKRDKAEMQPALYKQIIENKTFGKLKKIIIEGGEPTTWNYLYDFLYRFMKFHPKCRTHVITNGFKTDSIDIIAGMLKSEFSKQLSWSVSLNGLEKTHDKSRGVKDVFDKTVASAVILKEYGYSVAFSYVPFQENVNEYDKLKEFCKELEIPLWVCYYSKSSKFGEHQTWSQTTDEQYDHVYQDTVSSLKFYQKWAYEYFLDHVKRKKVMPCWAGRSMVHINPQGLIRPCHLDESMAIGHLTEECVEMYGNREELLQWIPKLCEYKTGELCNDCYTMYTIRNNMPKVLKWKLLS